jgi:hypothetical protein
LDLKCEKGGIKELRMCYPQTVAGLAEKGEEKGWKQTKKKNLMTYLHLI